MPAAPWRWAAFALLLVGPATAAVVGALRPGPSGHWSGHLAGAALSAGVAVAVTIGAALNRTRLPRPAYGALALTELGLVLEAVGNTRAARSLWRTTYDDAEAARYGPAQPGYEWGHAVAGWGDVLVVVGSLLLALALGLSRTVGPILAVVCGVLAFFPPWIYPALGSLVLLASVHGARQSPPTRHGRDRRGPVAPAS